MAVDLAVDKRAGVRIAVPSVADRLRVDVAGQDERRAGAPGVRDADHVRPTRERLLLVDAIEAHGRHPPAQEVGQLRFLADDAGDADDLPGQLHCVVDVDERGECVESRAVSHGSDMRYDGMAV